MFPSLGRGLVGPSVAAAVVAGVQVGELCPRCLLSVVRPRVLAIGGQQEGRGGGVGVIMGGQQVVRGRPVVHQVMGAGGTETRGPGQQVGVSVHLKQKTIMS